jgi:hypothetical protein
MPYTIRLLVFLADFTQINAIDSTHFQEYGPIIVLAILDKLGNRDYYSSEQFQRFSLVNNTLRFSVSYIEPYIPAGLGVVFSSGTGAFLERIGREFIG